MFQVSLSALVNYYQCGNSRFDGMKYAPPRDATNLLRDALAKDLTALVFMYFKCALLLVKVSLYSVHQ